MPTPRPIIAIRSGPKVGTVSTWLAANTIPNPMPTPASAIRRGNPIATTDPNATSMMMTAAVIPMPSLEPLRGRDHVVGRGAAHRDLQALGRAKRSAVLMTSLVAEPGSSASVASKVTTANPVLPFADS